MQLHAQVYAIFAKIKYMANQDRLLELKREIDEQHRSNHWHVSQAFIFDRT